jgi:uncharacterized protein YuzE
VTVRFKYDKEADAAYVWLGNSREAGRSARTEVVDLEIENGAINLDFDDGGRLIGIEILGASRLLPAALLEEDRSGDDHARAQPSRT